MGQYAVLHVSKGKGASAGLTAHNERQTTPKNADPEKSKFNVIEDYSHLGRTLEERAKKVIEQSGVKRKVQKDAVLYCPILLSGSNETLSYVMKKGILNEWMDDNKKFIENRFGKENVISFAMHADETTPHIHVSVVPILKGGRKKDDVRLSAKDMFSPTELKNIQTEYAEAMKDWGLDRGMDSSVTRAKHQDVKIAYRDVPEVLKERKLLQYNMDNLRDGINRAEEIIAEKEPIAKKCETIISQYEAHKNIYDKFNKAFLESSKMRPIIEELTQLKEENKGLVSQIKEIRAELDKSKANENYTLKMIKEFENDSLAAASKILTLEKSLEKALERPKEIIAELNYYQHERKGINHHFYIKDDGAMAVMSAEEYTRRLEEARLRKEEKKAKALAEAKEKESKAPTYDPKLAKPIQENKNLKAPTYDPDFEKNKNNNNQMKM